MNLLFLFILVRLFYIGLCQNAIHHRTLWYIAPGFYGYHRKCSSLDTYRAGHDPGWIGHLFLSIICSSFTGISRNFFHYPILYYDLKLTSHGAANTGQFSLFHGLFLLYTDGDYILFPGFFQHFFLKGKVGKLEFDYQLINISSYGYTSFFVISFHQAK